MKLLIAVGAATLLTGTASAQTATTDCTRDYQGNVRCTTQQRQGINWDLLKPVDVGGSVMDGFARGQAMVRQAQERQAAIAQQQAVISQQQAANEVARVEAEAVAERARTDAQAIEQSTAQAQIMADGIALARSQTLEATTRIRVGDCKGAEDYALSVGNLILAKQVKEYCAK